MERVRLTKRMASKSVKADAAEPATSIDLGKERKYRKIDEYHTFEPSTNHWEPDMRHEWKDNPREETGHGIPKMAKVYISAKKATRLASILLGANATEEAVEKQARAFMRMGDKALTASLERYAEANEAPVEEEVKAPEACNAAEEAPVEEAPVVEEVKAPEACNAAEEAPAEEAPVVEEAPAVEEADEEIEAADEEVEAEDEGFVAVNDELIDADVEFDEPTDGADTGADKELEACFSAEDEGVEEVAPAAGATARKAGVKKLAGQPSLVRVASKKADELSGLWDKW